MSARRRRLGVTALAVLAPVLVWLVADPLLGHRLRIADGEQTLDIGAVPVAVVALLASLAGWGVLAALERFGARPRRLDRGGRRRTGRVLPAVHRRRQGRRHPGLSRSDAPGGCGGADPEAGRQVPLGGSRCRQGVTVGTESV
ncbi:DUF6069 family protein [Streptomyces viridosporus]